MPCSSQNNSKKTKISQKIRQNKSVKLTITLDEDVNMISDLKETVELSKKEKISRQNEKSINKKSYDDKPINRCHLCGKSLGSKATLKRHIKGVHEKSKEEPKRILEKMSFKNTGNIQNNEN